MRRTGRAIRSGDCGAPDLSNGGHRGLRSSGFTGGVAPDRADVRVLYLITFATSIPALLLYQPVLDNPAGYVAGAGHDNRILLGAFLELLLIISNIGTRRCRVSAAEARERGMRARLRDRSPR